MSLIFESNQLPNDATVQSAQLTCGSVVRVVVRRTTGPWTFPPPSLRALSDAVNMPGVVGTLPSVPLTTVSTAVPVVEAVAVDSPAEVRHDGVADVADVGAAAGAGAGAGTAVVDVVATGTTGAAGVPTGEAVPAATTAADGASLLIFFPPFLLVSESEWLW